jgi:hypothetical protein
VSVETVELSRQVDPEDARYKRLLRNGIIRQHNRERAAENEHNAHLRPPMTTVVMDPSKPGRHKEQL